MKNWIILVLAAAVVILSVRFAESRPEDRNEDNKNTEEMAENTAYENILTRMSVRSYTSETVPDSIIEKLLRAGMSAPSAVNKQPWEFVVITDPKLRAAIAEASPNAGMAAKAPLSIAVCGNLDKALEGRPQEYWIQDCSAASENILLAAHALGLGGVWCGFYPSEERIAALRKILNLPDNLIPLNVINIGYPEGEPAVKDKWKPENIHYNRY